MLEGPIANCLEMSRVPVKSALKKLLNDGLVHQFDGRGYLVGNGKPEPCEPLRRDIATFNLKLPEPRETSTGLFAWETIFNEVEAEIITCIPFGTYRVKEAALCQRFKVSRTVAREVLSRLRDRGILEKDRGSQWIAGPLTAQVIREQFEIREIVEPKLLLRCAPDLPRNTLSDMLEQTRDALEAPEDVTPEAIIDLEEAMHSTLYSAERNRKILDILENNQLPFVVNALYARQFGVERELRAMHEHLQILEHLLHGLNEAAAAALTAHITLESDRTVAALKVLSVIPEPEAADYLVHIA